MEMNYSQICPQNAYNYTDSELDTLLEYKYYINGCAALLIIPIGIIANLITVYTLLHKRMRQSSTNAYLCALSLSNSFSLVCLFLMNALRFTIVHPYRLVYCVSSYENFINRSIPYLTPLNQTFQLISIYLIIAVSIDRYIIVVSKVINSKKRHFLTFLIIILICLISFLVTLPNWFMYESKKATLNNSIQYYTARYTKFGADELVKRVIHSYVYPVIVFGLPITILFVINTLIIFELIKISKRKKKLKLNANLDRNITYMLIGIVVVFLLCQLPLAISHYILALSKSPVSQQKGFFIYQLITNFSTYIYMSSNFVLFCFFGQKFRNTLRLILCGYDYKKRENIKKNSILNDNNFVNVSTYIDEGNNFSFKKSSFLRMSSQNNNNNANKIDDLNLDENVELNELNKITNA